MKKKIQRAPLVSVIISTYNHDQFIGRCLRSLLNQTMTLEDYEIVIINDCSTDNTEYALDLFISKFNTPIKVLNNKKNIGLPASLNKAIKFSQAPYIVRVDSDDYVNQNFLSFLSSYLDTNPKDDAIACDYYIVDDNEKFLKRVNCSESPIGCGIMFRRNLILDIGLYDKNFRYNEELEFRIRFEKKYKVHRLKVPMYRYRMHDKNITKNSTEMKFYLEKIKKKHSS